MTFTRRDFLSVSAVGVVAGAIGKPALARAWQQQPATPPPINGIFTPIRKDVGYFTGRGGTIGYLINNDGVIVVDSQSVDAAKIFLNGLKPLSGNRGVDVLINTHHHSDHTGGNPAFGGIAKHIVAQQHAVELQILDYETRVKAASDKGAAAPAGILSADRKFLETWTEKVGKEKVTAKKYTPAHTGGDAIVVVENANVVHMGDLLWNRVHPVIDRPNGASITNWIKQLEEIHKVHANDTAYICGHANPLLTPMAIHSDLLNFRDYLTALMSFVGGLIKEGRTREEVLARRDVLKGFEDYGPLVARPLPAAYDELTAKK